MERKGRMTGKNSIFKAIFAGMEYIVNNATIKKRTRIVIDYDPDSTNWTLDIFTGNDEPISSDIR